jgi:acyl-CoA dehydrogenase
MDFSFTQDQEELRSHARDLFTATCPPDYVERCDRERQPPREAYETVGRQGWLGLIVPEEYGGAGGSAIDVAILLEEAGRQYEELAMWMFRTMTWGGYSLATHGNEDQKQRFLPQIAKGELSVCFGLTEPDSGSDAAALTTKATATNDGHYMIDGQKVFTSGMDVSDYCMLVARTARKEKKQDGISVFMVDTKTPGIDVRKIETLGHNAIGTTHVFYNGVKVAESDMVGERDKGWAVADSCLWYERLSLSAARTGAASAAFELAVEYAKTRKQFGQAIGKFQAISHKLADMKVMLDVSRTMVYRFAWAMSEGKATRQDAAVLKLYTSEAYKAVADMALQIHGGYGYCMEYPIQRFFRDSRLATIGAGSSEIQRNIIARSLGL